MHSKSDICKKCFECEKFIMSKKLNLFTLVVSILGMVFLTSCDGMSSNEGNLSFDSTENDSTNDFIVSDYSIPENFHMTLQIADTSIFDKGDPWYYETAKIGNDWQFIHYDREAEDLSIQDIHFYKYISDKKYSHYIYNRTEEEWDAQEDSTSNDMIQDNSTNLSFFYEKPTGAQYEITETETDFDSDPTSIENYIDAINYQYSDGLDYSVVVDAEYLNLELSETVRDGSTICISWRAYRYTKEIDSWDISYLTYRGFKPSPF